MNPIKISIIFCIALLSGCSTLNANDPLERINRPIFVFNDHVDRAILKPIAKGYDAIVPSLGKTLIGNFFSNLGDVSTTLNDLMQLKFKQAFSDGMRVMVNTTIGIGGLVDVASANLEKRHEDFGQTLGYWGVPQGPYLVLPILGASTFRDGAGLALDLSVTQPQAYLYPRSDRNALYGLQMVDKRYQFFPIEELLHGASLDQYSMTRDAYFQFRINQVYDGNPPRIPYDDSED